MNLRAFATDAQNSYAAMLSKSGQRVEFGCTVPSRILPASAFKVVGGFTYAGVNSARRNVYQGQLMRLPRLGWAYQIGSKTVFRGGYGLYYDTNNVLAFRLRLRPVQQLHQ
jgi:hypothetical protein